MTELHCMTLFMLKNTIMVFILELNFVGLLSLWNLGRVAQVYCNVKPWQQKRAFAAVLLVKIYLLWCILVLFLHKYLFCDNFWYIYYEQFYCSLTMCWFLYERILWRYQELCVRLHICSILYKRILSPVRWNWFHTLHCDSFDLQFNGLL